jgi:dienelactone hydrolase
MKRLLVLGACAVMAAGLTAAAQELQSNNYEAMARLIIAQLVDRQFGKVTAQYDERLAQALPVDKLTASWDGLIGQAGEFKSITAVEQEERSGYHVVYATCAFAKRDLILVLAFNAKGQFGSFTSMPPAARMPWKPADYVKPETLEERAITVRTGHWELPGTLSLPQGAGPFPAVVLVHGSGPNDQDETFGPNKTFKDLAWGLAAHSVAVLRYTKRTRQYGAKSGDDLTAFTVKEEAMDDARSAVAMLAAMPEINPKQIYLLGHSEGGYLGPRMATGNAQIAGLIVMAGNTRPIEELVVEQVRYEANLNGPVTPEGQKAIDRAENSAKEFRNPELKPGMTVDLFGAPLPASYILDLRGYHPTEAAAALNIPILVLQGARDYQVTSPDFDGWKKALGAKPNVSFKLYPDLNHLFMPGSGPSSPAEYMKPNHVPEQVIADIAAWIAAHGKRVR